MPTSGLRRRHRPTSGGAVAGLVLCLLLGSAACSSLPLSAPGSVAAGPSRSATAQPTQAPSAVDAAAAPPQSAQPQPDQPQTVPTPTAQPQTAQPQTAQPQTAQPQTAQPQTAQPQTAEPTAPTGTAQPRTALAATLGLTVKGRAPRTGYDRDLFGAGWVDTDRNGCDTRNDILARDLDATTTKPGTRDCVVLSGTLADPYSGTPIGFVRGNATSTAVQIDHVVALSDAWQKGAQGWDAARRTAFANDPMNLLAVDGPLNLQKGDGDTATWLPPNKPYRCAYVARQVGVKVAYGLWVTDAEQQAMVRVLSTCPDEPLPVELGGPPAASVEPEPAAVDPAPAPAAVPEPASAAGPGPAPAAAMPFANCSAAHAAGAAPVHRGDPGYASHLDRDGDGVGCET